MSRKDVEAQEQKWLKAFNGGDALGVSVLYSENARLMPPNSEIIEGRAAIADFTKGFVATGAKLAFKLLTVHESPDFCVAVGTYEMDIPTGAEIQKDTGKFMEVWTRQPDGSWQIADDIFISSLPAPPG